MMSSHSALLSLFVQKTGKTTTQARASQDTGDREVYQRQGYWPDRSNRFGGW